MNVITLLQTPYSLANYIGVLQIYYMNYVKEYCAYPYYKYNILLKVIYA